jgi:CubicO group peptidase (beta-lactamase class C family)
MPDIRTPAGLQELLDELAAEHEVVGVSVAVLVDGDVVQAATGHANRAAHIEATPDTIFQIGSVTKVYTATLVMQLADEGKLDLDEPVSTYLPGVRFGHGDAARTVTIRQLLSHTSGVFGDHFEDYGRGDGAIGRFVDDCAALGVVHEPGETMSYCNAGYVLLGRLVEVLRDKPWHEALRDHLTQPLGAADTVSLPEEAILRRAAVGHVQDPQDPDGNLTVAPRWTLSESQAPAGSMTCATAADLLAFARLHLDEGTAADGTQLLSPASAKAMRVSQVALPSRAMLGASAWGLGWILFDWNGTEVIGHDGATLGQASFLRLVPGRNVAVGILTNGGKVRTFTSALASRILEEVADVQVPPQPQPLVEPSTVELEAVVGRYVQDTAEYRFRQHDGQLVMDLTPRSEHAKQLVPELHDVPLQPAGAGDFVGSMLGQPMTFSFYDPAGGDQARFVHVGFRAYPRQE